MDTTQIYVVFHPDDRERTELVHALDELVAAGSREAGRVADRLLADPDLRRAVYATCELADVERADPYDHLGRALARLLALVPSAARLRAVLVVDSGAPPATAGDRRDAAGRATN